MAVVFISPKQRQKTFLIGITIIFVLFLTFVTFGVLLSGPKQVQPTLVFNKPKISINTEVFDSEQFQELQPFSEMQIQFIYEAETKENKAVEGFVTAESIDDAKKILEATGLEIISIKEAEIGRENPFTPY